jgi:hypothetical protein
MAPLKLTRYRLCVLLACTVLPTFFLFRGIQTSRLSFLPFNDTVSLDSNGAITNNNATYPRLHFQQPHSEYAIQAKLILERFRSRRKMLFDGAVQELNNEMMDRLDELLLRAESDENYVPPKVI